jgi:transcriptional enhancer factor
MYVDDNDNDPNQTRHYFTKLQLDGRLNDLNLTVPEWREQYPEFGFLEIQNRHILVCSASMKLMVHTRPNNSLSIDYNFGTQQDMSVYESIYCATRFYDSGNPEADLRFDGNDIRDLKEVRRPCDYWSASRRACLRVAFGSLFWVNRLSKYRRWIRISETSVRMSLLRLTATQDIYGIRSGVGDEYFLTILWRFQQTRSSVEAGSVNWRVLKLSS